MHLVTGSGVVLVMKHAMIRSGTRASRWSGSATWRRGARWLALGAALTLAPGCGDDGGNTADARPDPDDASLAVDGAIGADGGERFDAAPDAAPVLNCPDSWLGTGDGCDCGCGVVDADCPTPTGLDDCVTDSCGDDADADPAEPSQCIPTLVPAGWTCSPYLYGDDQACTCGCGAFDDEDCAAPLTLDGCDYYVHGCDEGASPDPDDLTQCAPSPAGWTCHWTAYLDDQCSCGCDVADPGCPAAPHLADCDLDGCDAGQSPDPTALTECISNAPQDDWTCDLALLFDGSQCDCGCGAVDPDCGPGATAASCDVIHCASDEELKPGGTALCWERCTPIAESVGDATCTNGGFITIGNACESDLSACSDGHSYQVECGGGECVCRVDNHCVAHTTGGCSLNGTCGWSLIDATGN